MTPGEKHTKSQWVRASDNKTGLRLFLFSGLGGMYILFARYSSRHRLPVLCPFRRITGLKCPLCGFTTATASLLRGDVRSAVRAHSLAPVIIAGVLYWCGWMMGKLLIQWLSRLSEEAMHYGD